jgi:adenylyltransferase/sulfurtransferase
MALSDEAQRIEDNPELARYSRQMLFDQMGEAGQRKLMDSRVTLIGCGALGTVIANCLARGGVGYLRIVDRDFIEKSNLQRQVLFSEQDIADSLPKSQAAKRRLDVVNSEIEIDAVVADVNHRNIEKLCDGADLLLDGTDNFETRFLINDLAVKTHRPWVYGACISATGLVMAILPNDTPCIRCIFEDAPPPEMNPTCDTAGVLGPVVNLVASMQAMEAMKILMGRIDAINRHLVNIDCWTGEIRNLRVQKAYDRGDCPCCKQKKFDFLDGKFASTMTTLCGRNAVQINMPEGTQIDFEAIAAKVRPLATAPPKFNKFMLKFAIDAYDITVFSDGRAIIKGTNQPDQARTVYAKYVGA